MSEIKLGPNRVGVLCSRVGECVCDNPRRGLSCFKMLRRLASLLLTALCAGACSSPPAALPPAPIGLTWAGREPDSPPGTEGLRAAPCAGSRDLSASSPEERAFGPTTRSITGRTTLSSAPGAGIWSSSRPEALRFEVDPSGSVTLLAGEAGATLARLVGPSGEQASMLVSVPQFVRVRGDTKFDAMLRDTLGLAGRDHEVFAEAKRAIDAIYREVNVRVVWDIGLGERLPPQLDRGGFAEGRFIEATLHGSLQSCVTPGSSLLYTEFGGHADGTSLKRLLSAPVHVCPAIFARHPDALAWMVKSRARLLADPRGAELYPSIVGRAIAETLAHEVGHQLLGCDTSGERRLLRCHDRLPKSLM
ncbi:MAG: hypothetical protein JWM74_2385, partial [Myxococcaceae bacterium]|nr:hypothetical protein [Myxococcaceae bacterium]